MSDKATPQYTSAAAPLKIMQKDILTITPKRILVCQLRQIGDVLLATPTLELLRKHYPDAEIDVLTEKKCLPVLENNPYISKIWPIDKKALRNPLKALAYYFKVGRDNYDLIVDLQQLPRCKWVVRFSRAKYKITYTPPWYNRYLYTHWAPPIHGYAARQKASVLTTLGLDWNGEAPKIWLTDKERARAEEILNLNGIADSPFITIDPSHRRETRRWKSRHFAGLMRMLTEQHPELKFIVLYGPGELDLAKKVADMAGDNAIVTHDMLSLREMAAVQSKAIMHIGNCSSPRHFAVAVDTPSLTVHGATGFGWRYPSDEHVSVCKDLECRSCNRNSCPTIECLETYEPEECFDEALRLVEIGFNKKAR